MGSYKCHVCDGFRVAEVTVETTDGQFTVGLCSDCYIALTGRIDPASVSVQEKGTQ